MNFVSFKKFCSYFVVNIPKRLKSVRKGSETKMKVFLQRRNPLTGSNEWDIGLDHDEYDYHQEIARSAFADMLHDTERNKMYYRALHLAIEKMHHDGKKANVLDIGTGTGLLSMMAAKCGADTITACEAFKPMAECCLKILERNGYADKIKVIPKRSTEITVGEGGDMDQKANILVTEVFDTELIGEGALSTFSHAHKHLLEKDCIVVPDSAVIYAQVVECQFLQRWNKLEDVDAPELGVKLKTPQKMVECAGSAAVHDLQLSQVRRSSFWELSEPLPVFWYDWSGRSPLPRSRLVKQDFTPLRDGTAQLVFMWWELNMDTEGRIVLSCAPWWQHPAADVDSPRPEESVPWRDHWMQGVYYLPRERALRRDQEARLVSCQDEYSLWFYIEDESEKPAYKRPVCECGLHLAWSRTHVAHLNDERHGALMRSALRRDLGEGAVVLDLNGSSLLGLLAAKLAKRVYIHETNQFNLNILRDYIHCNDIQNVEFLSEIKEEVLSDVTNVIFDPVYASSLLPWENLKAACVLLEHQAALRGARVLPASFQLWARPVQFLHLHKIRTPLGTCEGFDVSIFDRLVERSRAASDAPLEPQPLWEYGARGAGRARRLLRLRLDDLHATYATDGVHTLCEEAGAGDEPVTVNGFVLWATWGEEEEEEVGGGELPERLSWEPHTRQAVTILEKPKVVSRSSSWSHQLACDLQTGQFDVRVMLVP